jgi:hypothetical protein
MSVLPDPNAGGKACSPVDVENSQCGIPIRMEAAIQELKQQGAETIDPFVIPDFDKLTKNILVWRLPG